MEREAGAEGFRRLRADVTRAAEEDQTPPRVVLRLGEGPLAATYGRVHLDPAEQHPGGPRVAHVDLVLPSHTHRGVGAVLRVADAATAQALAFHFQMAADDLAGNRVPLVDVPPPAEEATEG